MSDVSFLDINLTNVQEPTVIPAGTEVEYQVQQNPVVKDSKNTPGNKYINVVLEPLGHPDATLLYHMISIPNEKDDARTRQFKLLQMKRFADCFKIPFDANGLSLEGWVGKTGWVLVDVDDSADYGKQNRVKQFIQGR